MSREQSIGKINRISNPDLTRALHKTFKLTEGTDLLNQVMVTHRSDGRKNLQRKRHLNVSLTKELVKLVKQLSYIEGLCTDA